MAKYARKRTQPEKREMFIFSLNALGSSQSWPVGSNSKRKFEQEKGPNRKKKLGFGDNRQIYPQIIFNYFFL